MGKGDTMAAETTTTTPRVLSMEEFLDYRNTAIEYATIPGLQEGTVIRIGSVDAGDVIDWQEANEGEAKKTAGLRLIIKSLVDEKGERIGKPGHLELLRKIPVKQTERVVKAIVTLNGMDVKETDKAKND